MENEKNVVSEETTEVKSVGTVEESKQMVAGILAILLGAIGVHKFILGYKKAGLIMLLVTVLTCGVGGAVMSIIGLIEGIIYLTKTESEFIDMYQVNTKDWF